MCGQTYHGEVYVPALSCGPCSAITVTLYPAARRESVACSPITPALLESSVLKNSEKEFYRVYPRTAICGGGDVVREGEDGCEKVEDNRATGREVVIILILERNLDWHRIRDEAEMIWVLMVVNIILLWASFNCSGKV